MTETKPPRPTMERLRELFTYDLEAGRIFWRKSQGRRKAGDEAGNIHLYGYRVIQVDKQQFSVHALIWFLATGQWAELIDHINGKRDDNRLANLREADAATNARNRNHWVQPRGLLGAQKHGNGRFSARIVADGKKYLLGVFDTEQEAADAYRAARAACAAAEKKVRHEVLARQASLTVLEEMQAMRRAA